jgi:hypothetical protein
VVSRPPCCPPFDPVMRFTVCYADISTLFYNATSTGAVERRREILVVAYLLLFASPRRQRRRQRETSRNRRLAHGQPRPPTCAQNRGEDHPGAQYNSGVVSSAVDRDGREKRALKSSTESPDTIQICHPSPLLDSNQRQPTSFTNRKSALRPGTNSFVGPFSTMSEVSGEVLSQRREMPLGSSIGRRAGRVLAGLTRHVEITATVREARPTERGCTSDLHVRRNRGFPTLFRTVADSRVASRPYTAT